MRAVVLAAGKGIRMGKLTKDLPKVLIKIADKPFLWYLLKALKAAGISEIGLVVGYKKEKIKKFLESEHFNNIVLIEQRQQLGTGHAVSHARQFVKNEPFLVLMGDNLCSVMDIKELSKASRPTIAATEVKNPSKYGVLVCDGDKLLKIEEKPKSASSSLVNAGAYLLTKDIFAAIEQIEKSPRGEYELTDALMQLESVFVYKLEGYWTDMGSPDDIPKVEKAVRKLFNRPSS